MTNPYRTIDSSSLDLFVFNGAETIAEPENDQGIMRFGSYERRSDNGGSPLGQENGRHRILFKNDRLGLQNAEEDDDLFCERSDGHIFSWNLADSLGELNKAYVGDPDETEKHDPYGSLIWNNRPFASQLELANVPFTSSYWMTRLFDISSDSSRNVFTPPIEEQSGTEARNYTAHFPHLLNFYADSISSGNGPSLHRVFDNLEVPSRFVGTESYVNPVSFANSAHEVSFGLAPPFDTISNYRYPGKININTVLHPAIWQSVMDYYSGASIGVTYDDWYKSRNGSGGLDFANPFRPGHAGNLVPPSANSIEEPANCGLFREDGSDPLFDYDPASAIPYADHERSAYFKYDMRQRMGNLVTNRSSVYAVWITVGYFEVDGNGQLKSHTSGPLRGQGYEVGAEDGTTRRHRGFFLVDRSIPVAFEPGKNHNVDRAVILKTIID